MKVIKIIMCFTCLCIIIGCKFESSNNNTKIPSILPVGVSHTEKKWKSMTDKDIKEISNYFEEAYKNTPFYHTFDGDELEEELRAKRDGMIKNDESSTSIKTTIGLPKQ